MLKVGNDIVEIARMQKAFERHGILFLRRFLHNSEIFLALKNIESFGNKKAYFTKINEFNNILDSKNPYFSLKKLQNLDFKILDFTLDSKDLRIESIAGLWAIKEACTKALGCGIGATLGFKDMYIFKDKNGKPHIKINKKKKRIFKIKNIAISLSHERSFALATCIIT